jgi:hypothetical protein
LEPTAGISGILYFGTRFYLPLIEMGSKRTVRRKSLSQRGGSIYNAIDAVLSKYNGKNEDGDYKLNKTNLASFLSEINDAIQRSELIDPIFDRFKHLDNESNILTVRDLIKKTMEYIEEKEFEDPAIQLLNRNIDMNDFDSTEFRDLIKKFNLYLYERKQTKADIDLLLDQIKAYLKKIPVKYLSAYPSIHNDIDTVAYYNIPKLKLIGVQLTKLATQLSSINTDLVMSWGRPSEHSNSSASNSASSTSSPQPLATIPEVEDIPQTSSASETATKKPSFLSIPIPLKKSCSEDNIGAGSCVISGGSRKRKRKQRRNTRTKRRRRRQVKT